MNSWIPFQKKGLGNPEMWKTALGIQAEPEKKKSPWLDVGFAQGKATPFVFVGNVEGGNRKIQKKKLHLKIKMHIETHRVLSIPFFWVCVFWVLSKIQHTMNYECFKQWQAECSNIGKRNQQGFDQGGLGGLTSVMKSRFYINGNYSRWWFQIFFIFTPIWGRFPIWLIFFRWVETTNQLLYFIKNKRTRFQENVTPELSAIRWNPRTPAKRVTHFKENNFWMKCVGNSDSYFLWTKVYFWKDD